MKKAVPKSDILEQPQRVKAKERQAPARCLLHFCFPCIPRCAVAMEETAPRDGYINFAGGH
jgi:hypothetical protein